MLTARRRWVGLRSEEQSEVADGSCTLALAARVVPSVQATIKTHIIRIRFPKRRQTTSRFASMSGALPAADDDATQGEDGHFGL